MFVGATNLSACVVCKPGLCHHGSCSVNLDGSFATVCTCSTGWYGSYCDSSSIVVGATISSCGLVTLIALIFIIRRFRKRAQSAEEYSTLQEKLLHRKEGEISELKAVWAIDYDDVALIHRIDGNSQGAFGEVRKMLFLIILLRFEFVFL